MHEARAHAADASAMRLVASKFAAQTASIDLSKKYPSKSGWSTEKVESPYFQHILIYFLRVSFNSSFSETLA